MASSNYWSLGFRVDITSFLEFTGLLRAREKKV